MKRTKRIDPAMLLYQILLADTARCYNAIPTIYRRTKTARTLRRAFNLIEEHATERSWELWIED